MKAFNIQWDVDMSEIFKILDEMTVEKAAEHLEIPVRTYANMTTSERHDYAYDIFNRSPSKVAEFMQLPEEIEIPEGMYDEDEISDYISDKTGFCHKGFKVSASALS